MIFKNEFFQFGALYIPEKDWARCEHNCIQSLLLAATELWHHDQTWVFTSGELETEQVKKKSVSRKPTDSGLETGKTPD